MSLKEKKKEERLEETLLKVALGYQIAEVIEEYSEVDGALKLTKRKKTKKDVPPDLKAVQLLLSGENEWNVAELSDEELEKEKERLLSELALFQEENRGKNGGMVAVKSTEAKAVKVVKKKKATPKKTAKKTKK